MPAYILILLLVGAITASGQGFTLRNPSFVGKVATPVAGGGGGGAIAIGTVSSTNDSANVFGPLNHTVDTGTDLLIVFVGGYSAATVGIDTLQPPASGGVLSNASWSLGGLFTAVDPLATSFDASEVTVMYYLASPTAGSGDIAFGVGDHAIPPTVAAGLHMVAINVLNVNTAVGSSGIRFTNSATGNAANTSASAVMTTVAGDLIISASGSDDAAVGHESGVAAIYTHALFNGYMGVYTNDATSTSYTTEITTADYPWIFSIAIAPETP